MPKKITKKDEAWPIFDHIVSEASPGGKLSNPWLVNDSGDLEFKPDYTTLATLLGVPLHLKAGTQSGVPALALDVWLSYELRRAGFGNDQVWPRPTNPRVLPAAISALIEELPIKLSSGVGNRINKYSSIKGVTSSSAVILGKNYLKQVDVIISDWSTGPELLISTKRMDSSYGKNAPNRVEESYGDAKNLRLRHPLAALGFVFGLRSDIFSKEPKVADWLFDLLQKLGKEDDAYHATCLVLIEYSEAVSLPEADSEADSEGEEDGDPILSPGPESADEGEEESLPVEVDASSIEEIVKNLPSVNIVEERIPPMLSPGRFLAIMVKKVLDATPINMHEEARKRIASVSTSAS